MDGGQGVGVLIGVEVGHEGGGEVGEAEVGGGGLMAVARTWRQLRPADGPHPARREDIPALNQVFSDAFTERYRRDGMIGVRVPFLNPAIWR